MLLITQATLAVPLVVKLMRSRQRTGFSLASESMWVVAGTGWLIYGIGAQSVVLMISGVLAALTSFLVVLLIFASSAGQYRESAVLVAATIAGLILGSVIAGFAGLTAVLSIIGVIQFVPQFFTSLRDLRNSESSSGVSVIGTALRAFYTLAWAVYAMGWLLWSGEAVIDWPLITWGLAGCVTFTLQAFVARRSASRV